MVPLSDFVNKVAPAGLTEIQDRRVKSSLSFRSVKTEEKDKREIAEERKRNKDYASGRNDIKESFTCVKDSNRRYEAEGYEGYKNEHPN
jgi:hypothetical protein